MMQRSRAMLLALMAAIAIACHAAAAPDDATARLESAGYGPGHFRVELAWSESSPHGGGMAHGYRLQPTDGSPAFDLYLDDAGGVLSDDALAERGIAPKRWRQAGASASFQRVDSAQKDEAAPMPAGVRHGLRPRAEWAWPPLDPLAVEKARAEASLEKGPQLVGLVRTADDPVVMASGQASLGAWEALPDGRAGWALQVHDPGAIGIRLRLTGMALPPGASILVYDAYEPTRRYAVRPRDHETWTPTVFSDTAVVEVVTGANEKGGVSFQLEGTGHVFEDFGPKAGEKLAGACNLDVTCHEEYEDSAAAVGLYSYVQGASLFTCTGALIADADSSTQVPYFMTANHCVATQTRASTMEVFWFYQSAECDGPPPSLGTVPRSDEGAELLSTSTLSQGTDHTLVRINGDLPGGVAFLGWDAAPAPFGLNTVGIHHPRGSYKRIAFGPVTDCNAQSVYTCPSQVNLDRYYEVTWVPDGGVTEGGSSGSPIVNAETQVFLGQLWGGFASCTASVMADYYGKFDVTLPMVANWLNPTPAVIAINTNGGEDFKTRFPDITLNGTVSSSATNVQVNGSTEGVTYTAGATAWSYSGVLEEGPNTLEAVAFVGGVTTTAAITVTLDTNPPVITLLGDDPDFVELGGEYEDPGATAEDPEEGPVEVSVSGTVLNEPFGAESTLEYSASDSVGNVATVTRTVIVAPGPNNPPFLEITTDGGNGPGEDFLTAEPQLLLEGTVSANAVSITVNGSAEGVTHEEGGQEWTFEGELEEGENAIEVVAASAGGQETSRSIVITLDATPPVITLLGDNPDTVFVGKSYTDPGAVAEDERDGPVDVTVSGTVVSTPEGRESTLTYQAEDSLGNVAVKTRTVVAVVNPDEPPVVAITTNNGMDLTVPQATVQINGTTTSNTTALLVNGSSAGVNYAPGGVNWSFIADLDEGPNTFSVIADSDAGASAPIAITITSDTTPPVITLNGDNPDTVELGSTYSDPGATAVDAIAGPVSVTVSGFVANSPLGAQSTLTYRAVDPMGNEALATRTVVVGPAFSQPPDLTITTNDGANFLTNQPMLSLEGSVTSNATEVRVNDDTEGVEFEPMELEWSYPVALTNGPNTFEVRAVGPGGSSGTRTITVTLDNNPPVVTLNGPNPLFIPLGGPYVEPGATGVDPEDGAVPVTVSGTVAVEPLGTESIRVYRAQDAAGNVTEVTRTIIVGDEETLARIRLGSAVAPQNGFLSVPIVLEPSDEVVASLDFTVQYNSDRLLFERFESGPAADFVGASVQASSPGSGLVRLRVNGSMQQGGALAPGVVGRLVMRRGAAPLPSTTQLTATQAAGASVEGKALTVQVVGGIGHFIPGTLGPDTDGDGISDAAELLLGTDPERFDTNGNGFSDGFELLNGSDPTDPDIVPIPLPIFGDLNIDGVVNSVDVQLVINGALGLQTPMPTDVTGDGSTNATDVQRIINAALGLPG